jgi:sortase A
VVAPAQLQPGARLGVLLIPRLGIQVVIRQGTTSRWLALGPGHYPATSLPGQPGTVAIAGHRVTHTHPFLQINRIRIGDRIRVITRSGRFIYRVTQERIVLPSAVWVLQPRSFQQLVLTACHPPGSARFRFVVFARRVKGTGLARD